MDSDCYCNIISFLDIKDNMNISLVNKLFYEISKTNLIWASLFKNKFYNIDCTKLFYDNYIKCHKLNKFLGNYGKNINRINEKHDLSNNQLSSIPPEIGQLSMLQELYLDNNHLSSIPPEIGQLGMLNTSFV